MDREERSLSRKVEQAAAALRKALVRHASVAELKRLGDSLEAAQRKLSRYRQNSPPR